MTTWELVDDSDDAKHFVVTLSQEGLRRAANDNQLLARVRKPLTTRVAVLIGCELGVIVSFVLLVVDAIIRNS